MMNNIVIQHIETYWTKKSRGSPAAAWRNAVPEIFPISIPFELKSVILHEVNYHEHNHFKDPVIDYREIDKDQQRQLGFRFDVIAESVSVSRFSRSGRHREFGFLEPHAWLRVITNERVSIEHTWTYYKHVYNIYYGQIDKVDGIFSQAPVLVFNAEKRLW